MACVNACEGMSDPAQEIQNMRDVLKEAHTELRQLVEHINECREADLLRCDDDPHPPSVFSVYAKSAAKVVAELQPFV